jgi:hypothetical protein
VHGDTSRTSRLLDTRTSFNYFYFKCCSIAYIKEVGFVERISYYFFCCYSISYICFYFHFHLFFMQMVADEHGLQLGGMMDGVGTVGNTINIERTYHRPWTHHLNAIFMPVLRVHLLLN